MSCVLRPARFDPESSREHSIGSHAPLIATQVHRESSPPDPAPRSVSVGEGLRGSDPTEHEVVMSEGEGLRGTDPTDSGVETHKGVGSQAEPALATDR